MFGNNVGTDLDERDEYDAQYCEDVAHDDGTCWTCDGDGTANGECGLCRACNGTGSHEEVANA